MSLRAVVWVLAFAAAATGAGASVTVDIPAQRDAVIFGTSAGASTGTAAGKGPALFAGADGQLGRKRSLIEFDVASAGIPAGATVENVTMTLFLAQVAGSGGPNGGGSLPSRTVRLYAVQQNWTEGVSGSPTATGLAGAGAGYATLTGDATWDYASYDAAAPATGKWNAGGTDLHGGNFAATESAAPTFTSFGALNAPFAWSSAGMAQDVQKWLDGKAANFGWMLKGDLEDTATSSLGFWSRDGAASNANPAIAPSLSVTYSVPEPGLTAAAVGIALALAGRGGRRRRGALRGPARGGR
jgi:hypothetical protein